MNTNLEALFNLPKDDDNTSAPSDDSPTDTTVNSTVEKLNDAMSTVEKIDAALPAIHDINSSDEELDDIAATARETFVDLFQLGMNVEARVAGDIFSNATKLLDIALSAKTAKVDKKLKIIDLQLKKARLEYQMSSKSNGGKGNSNEDSDGDDSKTVVLTRNQILQEILNKSKT